MRGTGCGVPDEGGGGGWWLSPRRLKGSKVGGGSANGDSLNIKLHLIIIIACLPLGSPGTGGSATPPWPGAGKLA